MKVFFFHDCMWAVYIINCLTMQSSQTCHIRPLWWEVNLLYQATVMRGQPVMSGHCDERPTCHVRPLWWEVILSYPATVMRGQPVMSGHCDERPTCHVRSVTRGQPVISGYCDERSTCHFRPLWWEVNLSCQATVMRGQPVMSGHCDERQPAIRPLWWEANLQTPLTPNECRAVNFYSNVHHKWIVLSSGCCILLRITCIKSCCLGCIKCYVIILLNLSLYYIMIISSKNGHILQGLFINFM